MSDFIINATDPRRPPETTIILRLGERVWTGGYGVNWTVALGTVAWCVGFHVLTDWKKSWRTQVYWALGMLAGTLAACAVQLKRVY